MIFPLGKLDANAGAPWFMYAGTPFLLIEQHLPLNIFASLLMNSYIKLVLIKLAILFQESSERKVSGQRTAL